jgi:DNA repair exonuclease SbcCD ATPase subunit
MGKSQMNIQTIKRGLSPEEIKKEKEPKDNIEEQLASLKSSLEKASQNLAEKQEAASKDSSKKQTLKKEIEEVGTILETMEQVYYQKLELAKSVADKASLDLARVREQWRHDKDDVTDVQANIQRCQSQLSKLKEVSPTATREFQEQSAAKKRGAVAGESSEKRQKQK